MPCRLCHLPGQKGVRSIADLRPPFARGFRYRRDRRWRGRLQTPRRERPPAPRLLVPNEPGRGSLRGERIGAARRQRTVRRHKGAGGDRRLLSARSRGRLGQHAGGGGGRLESDRAGGSRGTRGRLTWGVDRAAQQDRPFDECPVWSERICRLLWIDTERRILNQFDPLTGSNERLGLPDGVGMVAERADGMLLVTLGCDLATVSRDGMVHRFATATHGGGRECRRFCSCYTMGCVTVIAAREKNRTGSVVTLFATCNGAIQAADKAASYASPNWQIREPCASGPEGHVTSVLSVRSFLKDRGRVRWGFAGRR